MDNIPKHFSFVKLGVYVVMPDHLHGIILINKKKTCNSNSNVFNLGSYNSNSNVSNLGSYNSNSNVETQNIASLQGQLDKQYQFKTNKFGPQSQNLGAIIRGFKIGVTKYIRQNTDFYNIWQSRYYDRVIRNQKELNKISHYIILNPKKWKG